MARMPCPLSPSSSCWPMEVEMTPGLMLLILAPRAPQARLAACTRSWLLRFATL